MAILLKQWRAEPNAGDAFSARVTAHVTGSAIEFADEPSLGQPNLIAVGSILHWADRFSTVWGSGFLDPTLGIQGPPRDLLAVRGPLSAQRLSELGLGQPAVLGDPGVFAPEIFPPAEPSFRLGIVPHYVDLGHPWVQRMAALGAPIVDPRSPLERYMATLTSCEQVAASSLHGLIFAHAYDIPAAWVQLSDRVLGDGFKFRDYFGSVGLSPSQAALDETATPELIESSCWRPPRPIDTAALREVLLAALPGLIECPSPS